MLDAQTIAALSAVPMPADMRGFGGGETAEPLPFFMAKARAERIVSDIRSSIAQGRLIRQQTETEGLAHARRLGAGIERVLPEDRELAQQLVEKTARNVEETFGNIIQQLDKYCKKDKIYKRQLESQFSSRYSQVMARLIDERRMVALEMSETLNDMIALFKSYAAKLDNEADIGESFSDPDALASYFARI